MTKLCCFNQDNPHFLVVEYHAELSASKLSRVLKLSIIELTGLSCLGCHAGKVP